MNEENARGVLPIAMDAVQVMQNILKRVDPGAREQMEMNLSFMVMFIDRLIGVVAVEDNSAKANKIMDQLAQFLWAILNNAPPLQSPK